MGNPKQKWTSEEEEALRAGVAKHGTGKWKNIQKDPEFNHYLYSRSNIDLKDKWRNMSVSTNGQGLREKSRTPKAKVNPDVSVTPMPTPVTSVHIPKPPALATPVAVDTHTTNDVIMEDASKSLPDGKTNSKYDGMIFEAISTLKEPNGSDLNSIVAFHEQKPEVPQNLRRVLGSRLRKLVSQNKLEKVQNGYRIRSEAVPGASSPVPQPKEMRARQYQTINFLGETVEEAAVAAAYKLSEAENKQFVAAEAVKETERVSRLAEETDAFLKFAEEIYQRCSRGETVSIAYGMPF